jgi:HSP20 family protein
MASGRQGNARGRQGAARAEGEGLGGLLKGLGDFVSLVERLAEQGEHHVSQEQEFTSPGGARGVYGFSVRLGVGGAPAVEHFGNVRATNEGPVVSETREPLVDVFDEGSEVVVVAEVPGVQEKDIHTELTGDVLALSATGDKRKYQKEILLPAAVDQGAHQQSYQNGYLELRFKKSKRSKKSRAEG